MTTKQKQILKQGISALLASIAGFAVVAIGHALAPHLPVEYQALVVSAAVSIAHSINPLGTAEKVDQIATDKAVTLTAKALDLEVTPTN